MLTTRFTELVGCSVPIQQAGMGDAAPPELAAAVSNAGALGMLGTARLGGEEPANLAKLIEQTRALTSRPFGINFIIDERREPTAIPPASFELAANAARVVEIFLWSAPNPRLFDLIHRGGALVSCQVGSREAAVAAVAAGADIIVAQGFGAGGHVLGTIGILALLDEVLDAVSVPVLAAGGIGSGRALAAVLAAGADGARVGTRFVAAEETGVHPAYAEALLRSRARDTVYTEAFYVNWPNAPHRVLRSSLEAAQAFPGTVVGELADVEGTLVPWQRYACGVPRHNATGAITAMSLFAGEGVGSVTRLQPAADIVRELAEGAEALLRRWGAHERVAVPVAAAP
jgi:NAD(P)H-dependent flavin oxidoreductase YrpB (nitropropane dioxygenase family)